MLFSLPLRFYPILLNFVRSNNRGGLKFFYRRIFAEIYREKILFRGEFASRDSQSIFVKEGNKNGDQSPCGFPCRDRKGVLIG
jgi:hypothetical protein